MEVDLRGYCTIVWGRYRISESLSVSLEMSVKTGREKPTTDEFVHEIMVEHSLYKKII